MRGLPEIQPDNRFWHRVRRLLASGRMIALAAALAVVLTLPSLRVGWVMDDYFHQLVLSGQEVFPQVRQSPLDLFRFMDGDPARTRRLMDIGIVPWWTWPEIRAGFWRPVSSATHWLDYRLWPDLPLLMHAQSIAWYSLLAAAVALLYRRVMGPVWVAGLAAVLYAIDDAHGMPVGWLANRNAVLAAFFGVAAMIAHDRWRKSRAGRFGAVAVVALALSLLSAEAGLATCAYLFAYAVFLEGGAIRRRLVSLVPYAVLVVAWRVAWVLQGYGVDGLGLYTDPLDQPVHFLVALIHKVPLLILGQWAGPPADLAILLSAEAMRWLRLAAVLVTLGLAAMLAPVVRNSPAGRFWACGMLLSLLPIAATFPSDRLLFFVGIGAMGLLALYLQSVLEPSTGRRPSRWALVPAGLLIIVHLVIAPLALPVRSGFPAGPTKVAAALDVRTPLDESVTRQDLIIVNAPSAANAHYVPIVRPLRGEPVPRRTRVLAPAVPAVVVHRPDERALRVRPEGGYLDFPLDRLFRDSHHPLAVGEKVELPDMTVEIAALTADGRPAEAVFRFAVPLEESSLRWLAYRDGEFVPFTPPAIGETIKLRAEWPW